jgi:hypothetical protein
VPQPTYTPLATVTLSSSASSVTFSSIPATYRDLILVVNSQQDATTGAGIRFNADSGSNYSHVVMRNSGGSPVSGTFTGTNFLSSWSSRLSGSRYMLVFQAMDYSATDKHKTVIYRNGYTDNDSVQSVEAFAARWANTGAVTSLAITTGSGNFSSGSTFNLFGVIA